MLFRILRAAGPSWPHYQHRVGSSVEAVNMVLYFRASDGTVIYMGRDKFENEHLIEHGWNEDVWFHVDKLSSAHVYLRCPEGMTVETMPEALIEECAQLVKVRAHGDVHSRMRACVCVCVRAWGCGEAAARSRLARLRCVGVFFGGKGRVAREGRGICVVSRRRQTPLRAARSRVSLW